MNAKSPANVPRHVVAQPVRPPRGARGLRDVVAETPNTQFLHPAAERVGMKVQDLRGSRGSLNHASCLPQDPFDVKAFHLARRSQGRGCVAVMDVGVSGVDLADGFESGGTGLDRASKWAQKTAPRRVQSRPAVRGRSRATCTSLAGPSFGEPHRLGPGRTSWRTVRGST